MSPKRTTAPSFSDPPGRTRSDTALILSHASPRSAPLQRQVATLSTVSTLNAVDIAAVAVTIESLRVELEGDPDLHTFLGLDPDGHAGYSALRATVELATDAPADVIETLHQRVIATSPVGHTLGRAIAVQIDLA